MKIFQYFVAAAMLLTSTSAMAQLIDTDNYTRVQVSYVAGSYSNLGDPGIDPKGFSLGIVQGYSVSDILPIFLEVGANINWNHSAEDMKAQGVVFGDRKFTNMNVAIPINGVYKYTLNDKVAFSGHAGLNCKVNMFSIDKISYDVAGYGDDQKINWLKKDDMGGRDNRGNIFQLGGQFGAGVHLSDFYLGWQFQTDFMKAIETGNGDKVKLHQNYITLGYQGDIFNF